VAKQAIDDRYCCKREASGRYVQRGTRVDVEPTYYAVDFGFRPPLRFPARGSSSARPSNSFSRSDILGVCCSLVRLGVCIGSKDKEGFGKE